MLRITEILPNPTGKDTSNEFIEITNFGSSQINLKGFTLDDREKGSKPYKFTEDTMLQPNESKAFYNSQTKIALNNTIDSARLFNTSDSLIDELKYDKTTEGKSHSYVEIKSVKNSKNIILETDPYPNKPTEKLYRLDGTITESENTTSDATQFTLTENFSQKPLTINYTSGTEELSSLIFAPSTEISILGRKRSTSTFDLLDFQIIKTASQVVGTIASPAIKTHQQNQSITAHFPLTAILFPIIIILIILTLLIKRNRIKSCKQL